MAKERSNKGKILIQAWLGPSEIETLDSLADKFSCSRSSVVKMIIKNINIDFNIDFNNYPEILKNINNNPNVLNAIKQLLLEFKNLITWDANNIHNLLKTIVTNFNLKFSELAIPLRVIVTGKEQTPSIDKVLELIGKSQIVVRITKGVAMVDM